jgi:hypothetical protein
MQFIADPVTKGGKSAVGGASSIKGSDPCREEAQKLLFLEQGAVGLNPAAPTVNNIRY